MAQHRVEDAPPEFFGKTLVQDLKDMQAIAAFVREHRCPEASIFICGMSTGAFLSVAFAHRKDLHPPGGIQGVWALACVDDIPSSVSVDFEEEQLKQAAQEGFCMKAFFPYGAESNPQSWKLGKEYIDSYASLPGMDEVAASLKVPLLLLHGEDDRHVPIEHAERLEALFAGRQAESATADVQVVKVPKGNHFLSSSSSMKKALAAIADFVAKHSASPG